MYPDWYIFLSNVYWLGYIEVNVITDEEKQVIKTLLRVLEWYWCDVFSRSLLGDSRKFFASSYERSCNTVEQFEAYTGILYFLFEQRSQKTLRAKSIRKCPESKSVLCFLLYVFHDVFVVHLQCLEEINSCSGVLLLTLFVRSFVKFAHPLHV